MSKFPTVQMNKAKITHIISASVKKSNRGKMLNVKIAVAIHNEIKSVANADFVVIFKRYPIFNYFLITEL